MPYKNTDDLPDSVRKHLPKHAQEIFLKAFNNAIDEYKDPKKRRDKSSNKEEVAFRVAWNAVKKSYKKDSDGNWIKK